MVKSILSTLASMKLTIALIVGSIILVYAGTWAQIDASIWQVQRDYFHSLFLWIPFRTFFPRPQPGGFRIPGALPFPGGYTIGALMLVNLLAAHVLRFKLSARRIGLFLIHAGLVLLLLGEFFTSRYAVESNMTIDEGQTVNYVSDARQVELAIIDSSPSDHDNVIAIDGQRLTDRTRISDSRLPFDVEVNDFYPNCNLLGPMQAGRLAKPRATAGNGMGVTVLPAPPVSGTDRGSDAPAAFVTLNAKGNSLGTYLVIVPNEMNGMLAAPQPVEVDGHEYRIQLRFKRYYKPYSLTLIKFAHDRYQGTDVAKNFSSRLRLVDPNRHEDREVLIWMNHPLRYAGETFYQASFKSGDKTTILQVVRNASWLMPYIACIIGGLGLVIHFGIGLWSFLAERASSVQGGTPVPTGRDRYVLPAHNLLTSSTFLVPAAIVAFSALYLIMAAVPHEQPGSFNLDDFATVPVSYEGRTQPLGSLAANSLRVVSGKAIVRADGATIPAGRWLLDVFRKGLDEQMPTDAKTASDPAGDYRIFRIDFPDVVALLGLDEHQRLFSINQIMAKGDVFDQQIRRAAQVEPAQRTEYQRALMDLSERLGRYFDVERFPTLFLGPPLAAGEQWHALADDFKTDDKNARNPGSVAVVAAINAYRTDDPEQFNATLRDYHDLLDQRMPEVMRKVYFETFVNRFDPFYQSTILCVIVFLGACLSWLFWSKPLRRAAVGVMVLAVLVQSFGLIARMYISGRPPVTNLTSSAYFIGWAALLFGLGLEVIFRNSVGTLVGAASAFTATLIGMNLSSGDSMAVLQAVLDTNFWLATHVVVITLGYSATFVAGVLAIYYIVAGVLTRSLDRERAKSLSSMIYGILCFALLFSFVGTILGGIWADQSWGRFWGWDPKENGAVLIVLWNALVLHARWERLVRDRGVAILAIGGNIVTSWSWFGTNLLGVGLHSYGFMSGAMFWLLIFVTSQLLLIVIGLLPRRLWRSDDLGPTRAPDPVAARRAVAPSPK